MEKNIYRPCCRILEFPNYIQVGNQGCTNTYYHKMRFGDNIKTTLVNNGEYLVHGAIQL